jgi:hypothetical protein
MSDMELRERVKAAIAKRVHDSPVGLGIETLVDEVIAAIHQPSGRPDTAGSGDVEQKPAASRVEIRAALSAEWLRRMRDGVADSPDGHIDALTDAVMSAVHPPTARVELGGVRSLLDEAWGIIANAGGGIWDGQDEDWVAAACTWRDRYHRTLNIQVGMGEMPAVTRPPADEHIEQCMACETEGRNCLRHRHGAVAPTCSAEDLSPAVVAATPVGASPDLDGEQTAEVGAIMLRISDIEDDVRYRVEAEQNYQDDAASAAADRIGTARAQLRTAVAKLVADLDAAYAETRRLAAEVVQLRRDVADRDEARAETDRLREVLEDRDNAIAAACEIACIETTTVEGAQLVGHMMRVLGSYFNDDTDRERYAVVAPVEDDCPHCSPRHGRPERCSWGVRIGADVDGDGQPMYLVVQPSDGSHVAPADARWLCS